MPKRVCFILVVMSCLCFAGTLPETRPSDVPPLPGGLAGGEFFDQKVWPILQNRCAKCHLAGARKGSLRLDSRDLILAGGDTGPAAVAHQSAKSLLIDRLITTDPDDLMPKKGPRLPQQEIDTLKLWIDRGLPWGKLGGPAKPSYVPPLEPREPNIPAQIAGFPASDNPIDRFVDLYFQQHHISPGSPVLDNVYARRVYLDAVGLLPTPAQLAEFQADSSADKRGKLVAKLLGDNQAYAENWMSFWDDALRNDYHGTGYIDGGRKQITGWLYNALKNNEPYDQFVRDLVAGAPGAEGYTAGIVWRGAVSASQRVELQAAQGISQVFLGINMKCASCHDSFINDWKLTDSYGLAAVYSKTGSLAISRCEKDTGKVATARFIYPQLGSINPSLPRAKRMQRLAELLTSPKDGRLSRTIVNRIWQRFMGIGLVEPADDMDKQPWNIDLLDFLASDLADHNFDLKHTITLILTSRAYQLPAVGQSDVVDAPYVFQGPMIRRLSGEQFCDAISQTTDQWNTKAATDVFPKSGTPAGQTPRVRAVWQDRDALMNAMGRPTREQVVTSRMSQATMLQALEFTNGLELNTLLTKAAESQLKVSSDPDRIARDIFLRSLGRQPTSEELAACEKLLHNPAQSDGVQDLYWSIFMLPEFQLIH